MSSGMIRSNACVRLRRRTGPGAVGRAFREMSSVSSPARDPKTSTKPRKPVGPPPFQILPPQRTYLYTNEEPVKLEPPEGKPPPLHPQGERPPASPDAPLPPSRRTNFVPTSTSSPFPVRKPYSGPPAFGDKPRSSADARWPEFPPPWAVAELPPGPDAKEKDKPRQPEGPAPYGAPLGPLIPANAPGKAPSTAFSDEPSQPPEGPGPFTPRRIPHGPPQPAAVRVSKYPPAFDTRPGAPIIYRSLYINNLPGSTTLTDLTQAIAAVGPIGTILSAKLRPGGKGHHYRITAEVEFNGAKAATRLLFETKQGHFAVKGVTPFVVLNTRVGFRDELTGIKHSRVLRITGPPDVPGFTKAGLRAVLHADLNLSEVMSSRGGSNYWGLESEPPREYMMVDGSGQKVIEWAFFSTVYQTIPIMMSLRRHFQGRLYVDQGVDPCNFDEARRRREQDMASGQTPSSNDDQHAEGFQFVKKGSPSSDDDQRAEGFQFVKNRLSAST